MEEISKEEIKHNNFPQILKDYPLLAAAASLFSAGVGQILCGRVTRGIILSVSSLLVTYSFSFLQVILSLFNVSTTMPLYVIQPVSLLMSLLIRVWAVYDAYELASKLKTAE
jgi:TM2 domain-containing membrane protein YozV